MRIAQITATKVKYGFHRNPTNMKLAAPDKVSFTSGLNYNTAEDIDNADITEIEQYFKNKGIKTDFNGNKVVAACSKITVEIFEKLKLPLPTAIVATDFSKHKGWEKFAGLCFHDACTINGKSYPARTVAFDTSNMRNARYYDSIENYGRHHNRLSSNHFLSTFIHEFVHSAHFKSMSDNLNFIENLSAYNKVKTKNIDKLKPLFANNASGYASTNLYELIAEIHTKDITEALDEETNLPKYNPFMKARHERHEKLNEIINKAWIGKIDF